MITTTGNFDIHLEPYKTLIERKYIAYIIWIFLVYSFINIVLLLDYLYKKKKKKSINYIICLCFITSVSLGLLTFFLLIHFNICL
ncbi:conserved protein, unknown function [Hepatocystis sp. ex Piliocolobus tephrosceles]|nr:conserved protein, unknown function [Hepatocystis sp. ex Piliocolobus tephrosceles]